MKKWFRLFAALCLAAVLCVPRVPLAACEWGSEPGGSENGGSENGGNSGDPSAVRTTVTEEWNAAVYGDPVNVGIDGFLDDPEANVTIVSATSMTGENGEVEKHRIEVQIDGNKRYYKFMEQTIGAESEEWKEESYGELLSFPEDGEGIIVMNVYSKDENGKWTVEQNESTLVRNVTDIVDEYVEMYDFENFTYNASLRQYEAKDLEFDFDEEFGTSLTIDFMAFHFENGKLMHSETKVTYEQNEVVYSIHSVGEYENGRVVRSEQQVEQKGEDWSYSAVSSMTYSYGTASVTLPVVGE